LLPDAREHASSPYAAALARGEEHDRAGRKRLPCLAVCADGTGAFTSIREAIRRAAPRSRIEVWPGLYREALVIDKPLEIVGMGTADEIVVESGCGPCLTMRTARATVRGLTLRGGPQAEKTPHHVVDIPRGRLQLEDCRIVSGARSCLAIHGTAADPIIRRCTIEHGKESGVLLYDTSQCLLEDCEISGNAVGISILRYACPTIRRCRVRGSVSHGIDAEEYAEGAIDESDVVDNGQAGVCIGFGSMLSVRDCRINRNERAVVVASNGGGTISGCDLSTNTLGAWAIMPGGETWLRRSGNYD
jgi:parallel beta-helix repeat protein